LRGKKPDESQHDSHGSRAEEEDKNGRDYNEEEEKDAKSKTDRRFNDQRGGSGMPFDAGTLDSPNSQTNLKKKDDEEAAEKKSDHMRKKSSKDDLGWQKEDAKGQIEDEKQEEDVSLLDAEQDKDLYSNEVVGNKGKRSYIKLKSMVVTHLP
jgi:hypothetical protein